MTPDVLDRPSLRRVLEDLLRAEIALARGGAHAPLPPHPWHDDLPIGAGGLAADSLELLTLAGAVNEMFHVHDSALEDLLLARRRFGDWLDLLQQAWREAAGRISFRSSGSTGQPKRCTHAMDDLRAEVADHTARLRPSRVLSAVPAHHIYGFLFSVLLPLHAGCAVVDVRAQLPATAAWRPGDVLVSYPDHWRFLARSLDRLPAVTGVTSTAPMPGELARDLRARGLARLVEIYGASETAGIGWRDDPDAPFTLLPAWSAAAAAATEGVLHLAGRDGRMAATPDVVAMAGARAFHVQRRCDGAVQVGGCNVYPARVALALEGHPLVAQARVRLAAQGGRLKAVVVPRDPAADADAVRRELEDWIARHLPTPERPRSLVVAARLPVGALGKDGDWMEAA